MAVNSNSCTVPKTITGPITTSGSIDLAHNSHSLLGERNASVLDWLSRIRGRLQELWKDQSPPIPSKPTIHFYLTVTKGKQRLRINHLACEDPNISEGQKSNVATRLNQLLHQFKEDKLLDEHPNMVGFWVSLRS